MSVQSTRRRSSTGSIQNTPSAKPAASPARSASTPSLKPRSQPKTAETKMVQTQANPFGKSDQPDGLLTLPKSHSGQLERGKVSKNPKVVALASKQGKAGTDAVQTNPNQLETKALADKYRTGEQEQPSRRVTTSEGKQVQVHNKDWQQGATTQYFDKSQKAESKLDFKRIETPVESRNSNPKAPFATESQLNASLNQGGKQMGLHEKQLFVMDGKGKVYSSDADRAFDPARTINGEGDRRADVHHSSFLKGAPVAGAGEMITRRDGTLGTLTDASGHYEPGAKQTLQTMNELGKNGVNLQNTKFEMHRGTRDNPQVTKGTVAEFRQGEGSESLFKARHDVADKIKANGTGERVKLDSDAHARAQDVAQKTAPVVQPQQVAQTGQATPVKKRRAFFDDNS